MLQVNFKFALGAKLRDKVTGLTGIAMVRAEYATGCHHYGIQPTELNNGKPIDWEWLDVSRLELADQTLIEFNKQPNRTSGPSPKGPQL